MNLLMQQIVVAPDANAARLLLQSRRLQEHMNNWVEIVAIS